MKKIKETLQALGVPTNKPIIRKGHGGWKGAVKVGAKYKVNSIFDTIQGEGGNSGAAVTFLRFAKCNLSCSYCDTEFEEFTEMNVAEICYELRDPARRNILISGGEPLLQLDDELVGLLHEMKKQVWVETSGSVMPLWVEHRPDYITCSPKQRSNRTGIGFEELRIPVVAGKDVEHFFHRNEWPANRRYVSPVFGLDDQPIEANVDYALELMKKFPGTRLSMQVHKWIGAP